jgi:hypothetical protein
MPTRPRDVTTKETTVLVISKFCIVVETDGHSAGQEIPCINIFRKSYVCSAKTSNRFIIIHTEIFSADFGFVLEENLLSSRLLSKNLKIRIYKTKISVWV